jgi:hypothetical protein
MARRLKKLGAVLGLVVLILALYFMWARPFQLGWGATSEELSRPMPGDELNPNPKFLSTRAITIDGPPEQIWPWLLQMGYGRAGFYGYDILENVGSKKGIHSAESIIPELQHYGVGDPVPISPAGGLVFYAIEPYQYIVWSGEPGWGGFTWALYPIDQAHTRLVSRIRWSHSWTNPSQLALDLFTEFTDHLAIRKILLGVKGRVEGNIEPMARANIEFGIYLATLLVFLTTLVLLLLEPLTWRRWLVGLAAGLVWLLAWYSALPIWMSAIFELGVLFGALSAFRRPLTNSTS